MATLICEPVATRRGRSFRRWVWAARLEFLSLDRPVAARRSSAIGWVSPIMRALPLCLPDLAVTNVFALLRPLLMSDHGKDIEILGHCHVG